MDLTHFRWNKHTDSANKSSWNELVIYSSTVYALCAGSGNNLRANGGLTSHHPPPLGSMGRWVGGWVGGGAVAPPAVACAECIAQLPCSNRLNI